MPAAPHKPNAPEPGTPAGGSALGSPGAFFGRFFGGKPNHPEFAPVPAAIFADQVWLVTFQRPNRDVCTEQVLINGGNLQIDIAVLARCALPDPHDRDCAMILRVSMDFTASHAHVEILRQITNTLNARLSFEAECG